MSKSLLTLALLLCVSATAGAQTPPQAAKPSPSLYAINSAGLASAMTYCSTKHGNLLTGSPGHACFTKARQVLAEYGLKKVSADVDARCNNPWTSPSPVPSASSGQPLQQLAQMQAMDPCN